MESTLAKRGKFQRRLLIILGLWVLCWSTLTLDALIRNTGWQTWIMVCAVTNLFLSIVFQILYVPLAMIGRYIGNRKQLWRYRYWLTFALPVVLSVFFLVSAAISRLFVEQKFESLTGVELPAGAEIIDYQNPWMVLDGHVAFEIKCSPSSYQPLHEQLTGQKKGDPIAGDPNVKLEGDPSTGIISLSFDWI